MFHLKSWIPAASVIGALIVLQSPLPAYGSGFGIFTQGASALGQADAVVAHSSGPSAIFFNPALMNGLPGTQIEIGTTLLFPSRDFKSATTGGASSTEDTVYYPSTFYVSHTFNDKFSAGLGVFNPFGLGNEWNGSWEGRYILGATKSTIETYDINPVVSYRITPNLSFAAGLDVILLDATLENRINLTAFGLSDANQKFKGDGTGVGYNLGVAYNAGHGISLGASYRSEVDVDVKGGVNFNIPAAPPPFDGLLAATLPNSGGKTTITLPRQLLVGVAYQANDRLTIETGFRWEDWRSFNELKIELNQPVGGQSTITSARDWHDTFAVNVGGKYRLNDTFTLLAGYLYGWNPVPDRTFEPVIADANTHLFCAGGEAKLDKLVIAMSYAYQLQEERIKNNNIGDLNNPANEGSRVNGTYNADIHLLGLSLKYQF
jgi:long-chain fatty acid transport protein